MLPNWHSYILEVFAAGLVIKLYPVKNIVVPPVSLASVGIVSEINGSFKHSNPKRPSAQVGELVGSLVGAREGFDVGGSDGHISIVQTGPSDEMGVLEKVHPDSEKML